MPQPATRPQSSDCPPRAGAPSSSTTFRVVLPDGRVADSSQGAFDNEWELQPDDGSTTVEITARVAQTVELDALRYVIKSDDADAVIKTFEVGRVVEGEARYVLRWDLRDDSGEPVPPGRYHLFAVTEVGADERNRCISAAGATEQFGIGYLAVP